MKDVVRANNAHRLRTIRDLILLVVVGGYGGSRYWEYLQNVIATAEVDSGPTTKFHLVMTTGAGLGLVLLLVAVAGTQTLSLGYRIMRSNRYPTVEMNVLFDTPISTGGKARLIGAAIMLIGLLLLGLVLRVGYFASTVMNSVA